MKGTPFYKKPLMDVEVLSLEHCDTTDPEEVEYHQLLDLCVQKNLLNRRYKMFSKDGGWHLRTFGELRSLLHLDNLR